MSISREEFEDRNAKGPVIVEFKTRGHALESWNCMKNVMDQMNIPPAYAARIMETMSIVALALDDFDRKTFNLDEAEEQLDLLSDENSEETHP